MSEPADAEVVVDYSWERPEPADIAAAGYTAAIRYLSHEPGKNLSAKERDALFAAGLAVGLVWESTANRALAGYDAGSADAIEANRQADALGWPKDRVIYYAVDIDVAPQKVSAYFQGVRSVLARPPGVYGTYRIIEGLVGGGIVGWGWQCAAWSGKGDGSGGSIQSGYAWRTPVSKYACLFQHQGLLRIDGTDHNQVLTTINEWAWHPGRAEEDDMAPPIILWTEKDSAWAVKVGGRPVGDEEAAWLAYPSSGVIVHIVDEDQLKGNWYVHVEDRGFVKDQWFYNFHYEPHVPSPAPATPPIPVAVDVDSLAKRLIAAVARQFTTAA